MEVQTSERLHADGTVGGATWQALESWRPIRTAARLITGPTEPLETLEAAPHDIATRKG